MRMISLYFQDTLVAIKFLIGIAPVFDHYLTIFQSQGPLVHCMYSEMKDLLSTILGRFLKPSLVQGVLAKDLVVVDVKDASNHKELSKMDFGMEVKTQVFSNPYFLDEAIV